MIYFESCVYKNVVSIFGITKECFRDINILPSTHYPMVDNGPQYAIYSMVNDDDDILWKSGKFYSDVVVIDMWWRVLMKLTMTALIISLSILHCMMCLIWLYATITTVNCCLVFLLVYDYTMWMMALYGSIFQLKIYSGMMILRATFMTWWKSKLN